MLKTVKNFLFYHWQAYVINNLTRYNVILAPRQHGKTTLVCEVINTVAHAPNLINPLINLCSDKASRLYQLYSQRLNALFGDLDTWSWTKADVPSSTLRRQDFQLALINFIGSIAKPTGCTGTPSHLNVIDECELVDHDFIFESAMPATDKTKGITICTGTWGPRIKDLYKYAKRKMDAGDSHWFAFEMSLDDKWSRQALTHEERKAIRSRYDLSIPAHRRTFNTQYIGDIQNIQSAQYPYLDSVLELEHRGRIRDFHVQRDLPVNLTWDDGRGCTAIWAFQAINNVFYFFDYFEWQGTSLPEIAKNRYMWYEQNNFIYGVQVLPHTIKERSYMIEGSPSRYGVLKRIFKDKGAFCIVPKTSSVANKFSAGLSFLPNCFFHSRARNGISGLKGYARVKIANTKNVYKDEVSKNDCAHCGDAITEIAMSALSGQFMLKLNTLRVPMFDHQRRLLSVLSPY